MNKICKEYMGNVKALFPIVKKQEKLFLKKLSTDVEQFCEDANINSKLDLYDNYGTPYEVVSNYLSTVDTDYIVKQLRVSKLVRKVTVVLMILATIATTMLVMFVLHRYNVLEHNRLVVEEEIVDYGTFESSTSYTEGFLTEEFY